MFIIAATGVLESVPRVTLCIVVCAAVCSRFKRWKSALGRSLICQLFY